MRYDNFLYNLSSARTDYALGKDMNSYALDTSVIDMITKKEYGETFFSRIEKDKVKVTVYKSILTEFCNLHAANGTDSEEVYELLKKNLDKPSVRFVDRSLGTQMYEEDLKVLRSRNGEMADNINGRLNTLGINDTYLILQSHLEGNIILTRDKGIRRECGLLMIPAIDDRSIGVYKYTGDWETLDNPNILIKKSKKS